MDKIVEDLEFQCLASMWTDRMYMLRELNLLITFYSSKTGDARCRLFKTDLIFTFPFLYILYNFVQNLEEKKLFEYIKYPVAAT